MRLSIPLAAAGALCMMSTAARADSYMFGGESRRVKLDIFLLGFNDGAGAGGWDDAAARELATWAKRVDTLLPKGAAVSLIRTIDDDDTTLTIHEGPKSSVFKVSGAPDYAEALGLVAGHFKATTIASVSPAKLYTLQLFATYSQERANRFARALDERDVSADGSFYFEACLPCAIPQAHVLEPNAAGLYRVVTGIFDRFSAARRSLTKLHRRWKLSAFVREL
jgi:hypothetical protein